MCLESFGVHYKEEPFECVSLVSPAINHAGKQYTDFNSNMKTSTLFLGALAAFQYALAASVSDTCTVGYCTLNGG